MPSVGFICPKDSLKYKFIHCLTSCSNPCYPLPFLSALAREFKIIPGTYHVTELLSPLQVAYLSRRHDYYVRPEKQVWATFGVAWHSLLESQIESLKGTQFIVEKKFEIPINGAILTGRVDLYDTKKKTLWDWKTAKAFAVSKLKEGKWDETTYHWQVNIYRYFGFPDAEKMNLFFLVKDYSAKVEREMGIKEIEVISVPWIDDIVINDFVKTRIGALQRIECSPDGIPECTSAETWGGRRCAEYCGASEVCPQYQRISNERENISAKGSKTIKKVMSKD